MTIGPSDPITIIGYDRNGDLQVDIMDFVGFAGAYLSADPSCDYDCDGMVGLTDFIEFANHYQHTCW